MKNLIAFIGLLLISMAASADCYPIVWRLPGKGKDCKLIADFERPSTNLIWSCPTEGASNSLFLITGDRVTQPEGDICLVVKKVIRQN